MDTARGWGHATYDTIFKEPNGFVDLIPYNMIIFSFNFVYSFWFSH